MPDRPAASFAFFSRCLLQHHDDCLLGASMEQGDALQQTCACCQMLMLTSTSSSACPVNEELGLGWEVIVDDVVQEWQVNAAGSHISDNQDAGNACPEFAAVNAPRNLYY